MERFMIRHCGSLGLQLLTNDGQEPVMESDNQILATTPASQYHQQTMCCRHYFNVNSAHFYIVQHAVCYDKVIKYVL